MYKCDDKGFFTLEGGNISGISCGVGAIEALYDGKKLEYSVEVTEAAFEDTKTVTNNFEQEAGTGKQYAWVLLPVSVLLGIVITFLIKRRNK